MDNYSLLTGPLHEQALACACRSFQAASMLSTFRAALRLVNGRLAQTNDCLCRGRVREHFRDTLFNIF